MPRGGKFVVIGISHVSGSLLQTQNLGLINPDLGWLKESFVSYQMLSS